MSETAPLSVSTAVIVGPGRHFGQELVDYFRVATSSVLTVSLSGVPFVGAVSIRADMTQPVAFTNAIRTELERLPALGVVVFNAKVSGRGPALGLDPTDFSNVVGANLCGALSTFQFAATQQPRTTAVRMIVTQGGFKDVPDPDRLGLSAAKAGLESMSTAMAPLLNSLGVGVQSLTIDGVVRRQGGKISPADVVAGFRRLVENPTETSVTVR